LHQTFIFSCLFEGMVELTNIALLAAVYVALNILAFMAYGLDKLKASAAKWRISEKTLLILAFFGPFGGYAGMLVCRHKTQKKLFSWTVPLFIILHIVFIAIFIYISF
jgi:Predicted membrane protein